MGRDLYLQWSLVVADAVPSATTMPATSDPNDTPPERVHAIPTSHPSHAAFKTVLRAIRTAVWDIERQQFVDEKDFVNKNFTS